MPPDLFRGSRVSTFPAVQAVPALPTLSERLKERIGSSLAANRRVRAMARIHACLVAEGKQHRSDRAEERRVVSTGEVGSTDGPGEQCVAHEQVPPSLARSRDLQTHTARTVSRRVMRPDFELAEGNLLAWSVEAVDWREIGVHFEAKQQSLLDGLLVEEEIVAMQMNR